MRACIATILLASTIWLSGCTQPRVLVRAAPLPLPARPVLAPVAASSVACLSDNTYRGLVNRERALRTWGLELEAIIQTNNRKADGHDEPK